MPVSRFVAMEKILREKKEGLLFQIYLRFINVTERCTDFLHTNINRNDIAKFVPCVINSVYRLHVVFTLIIHYIKLSSF